MGEYVKEIHGIRNSLLSSGMSAPLRFGKASRRRNQHGVFGLADRVWTGEAGEVQPSRRGSRSGNRPKQTVFHGPAACATGVGQLV